MKIKDDEIVIKRERYEELVMAEIKARHYKQMAESLVKEINYSDRDVNPCPKGKRKEWTNNLNRF